MRAISLVLCFKVLACLLSVDGKRELPAFVKVCHQTDPNLNDCIKASILELLPYLGKGIPEMRVPAFNPLKVPHLSIHSSGTKFDFEDIEFYNLDQFTVENVTMDVEKCSTSMNIFHPSIPFRGMYSVTGKLIAFDLQGSGLVENNVTSVHMSAAMNCKRETKKEKVYLKFTDINFNAYIDDMKFIMHNLFPNNPELTARVNAVLNENSKVLAQDFQPLVSKAIQQIVFSTVQGVFDAFPEDVLLPK